MTDLGRYHNDTVGALGADEDRNNFTEAEGERYDHCADLAIDLIFAAQAEGNGDYIGPVVADKLDVPVSEDVQTLLTLALFRYPDLFDYLEKLKERPEPSNVQWLDKVLSINPGLFCTTITFTNGVMVCSHALGERPDSIFVRVPTLKEN